MPDPLVTVIIPCCNHGKWVKEAIRSVADQSYPRKRIVMVDDGSKDDSIANAVSTIYKPRGPESQKQVWACWGKVLNSDCEIMIQGLPKTHGPSFARNWGINVTFDTAEDIYFFLDSDDWFLPGKIEKSVELWKKNPEVGMVYSDYCCVNPDGLVTRIWSEPFSRKRLCQQNIINPLSLVTKAAIERVGLFDETLRTCEDFNQWLKISEHFPILHLPEVLAMKRVGPHDSTSTVSKDRWEADYRRVMEMNRQRAMGAAC